jgi:hypothetical protein
MVFRDKSEVNGLKIGLPFFEPEKMSFAITQNLSSLGVRLCLRSL